MPSFFSPFSSRYWQEVHVPRSKSVSWETMLQDWQRSADNIFINGHSFASLVATDAAPDNITFIKLLVSSLKLTPSDNLIDTSPLRELLSRLSIGQETYHLAYKDFMAYLLKSALSEVDQQALIDLEVERQILILEELFEGDSLDIKAYALPLLHLRLACFQGGRQDDAPSAISLRLAEKQWSGSFSDKTYHLSTTDTGFALKATATLKEVVDNHGQPVECASAKPYLIINSDYQFSDITTTRTRLMTQIELRTASAPVKAMLSQESAEEKLQKKVNSAINSQALSEHPKDKQLLGLTSDYFAGDLSDNDYALCLARYTAQCKASTQSLVRDCVRALPFATQLAIQQAVIEHLIAMETSPARQTDIAKLSVLKKIARTLKQLSIDFHANTLSLSQCARLTILYPINLNHQQCMALL